MWLSSGLSLFCWNHNFTGWLPGDVSPVSVKNNHLNFGTVEQQCTGVVTLGGKKKTSLPRPRSWCSAVLALVISTGRHFSWGVGWFWGGLTGQHAAGGKGYSHQFSSPFTLKGHWNARQPFLWFFHPVSTSYRFCMITQLQPNLHCISANSDQEGCTYLNINYSYACDSPHPVKNRNMHCVCKRFYLYMYWRGQMG